MSKKKQIKINQINLMAAICAEICEQQGGNVPADHNLFNAIIEGANKIKADLDGMEYTPIKG